MKHTTTLLILLTLFRISASAQGIQINMINKDQLANLKGNPKMMKKTESFYNKSREVKTSKELIEFDKFGLPKSRAKFNDDNTVSIITYYKYDSVKRVELERHIEDRNVKNRTSRVHFYSTYEHDYPVKYQQMNANNVIVSETLTKLNDQGLPIEATLFEPQGNLIGTEIATYYPDKSQVAITVMDSRGRSLNTDTMYFSPKTTSENDSATVLLKEKSDAIKNAAAQTGKTYTEFDSIYDQEGNCTKKTRYDVNYKPNGKKKRVIRYVLENEIQY